MHAPTVGARLPAKTGGSTPLSLTHHPSPGLYQIQPTRLWRQHDFSRASALLHLAAFAQRLRIKCWSAIPAKRSTRPARNLRV
jgi:hypothetical protein